MTKTVVDTEVIAGAVQLACRAPSLHNSQPWRWTAHGGMVDLFGDPSRGVRSTDRSGREAIISCGAVLDHFRVAMAAAGWNTHVDPSPNPNNVEHLASIDFSPMHYVTQGCRVRAAAIGHRRTDRLPFRAPRTWQWVEPLLRDLVSEALVSIDVLSDGARPLLAEASRLTETMRRYDDAYHRELEWWTGSFREFEGIPASALVSESERERVEVNRAFPVTGHEDRRAAVTRDEAKIVVLSTSEDSRTDAFNCGQALSTVLLECTTVGLATCTLTHITEFPASRDIIRELTGRTAGMPQVLVRVGRAPALEDSPPPTPRRPLSDVLTIHS